MKGFQVTERIERPIDQVWRRLTDWERAGDWMRGVDRLRVVGGGQPSEGAEMLFVTRGKERSTRVVAWQPPKQVALASTQGGITATYRYRCTGDGDATEVTLDAVCEARGVVWKLLSPLISRAMKRADGGQIAALKQVVESD